MFQFLFSAVRNILNAQYLQFPNQNIKRRQTWVGPGWFCMPENGIFRSGDGWMVKNGGGRIISSREMRISQKRESHFPDRKWGERRTTIWTGRTPFLLERHWVARLSCLPAQWIIGNITPAFITANAGRLSLCTRSSSNSGMFSNLLKDGHWLNVPMITRSLNDKFPFGSFSSA